MARELDVRIVLVKPVREANLIQAVGEMLAGSGRGRRGAAPVRFGRPEPRILVVEADPASREETVLWLGQLGCSVTAANNGYEAVQASGGRQVFDAILMNCDLPIMDGLEATAWIRINSRAHTPIIGLTANATGGERRRCLDAGMDDYMVKPAGADGLLDMIRRWAGPNAKAQPRVKGRAAGAGVASVGHPCPQQELAGQGWR